MLRKPQPTWASICVYQRKLRRLAKDHGCLAEYRSLREAALRGTDTLEDWHALHARLGEADTQLGDYTIRGGSEGSDDEGGGFVEYSCPTRHKCEQILKLDTSDEPPICRLTGWEMTRVKPTAESIAGDAAQPTHQTLPPTADVLGEVVKCDER